MFKVKALLQISATFLKKFQIPRLKKKIVLKVREVKIFS